MFASSVVEAACRTWGQAPRISHWVFEAGPGQIRGCDGQGRVLMAIEAGPAFGQRLAAAFDAASAARHPDFNRAARLPAPRPSSA